MLISLAAALPTTGGRPAPHARDVLFRETLSQTVTRWALGLAYSCHPKRLATLPRLMLWSALDTARGGTYVPLPARDRKTPDTFGGVALAITPERIVAAARRGYFPWCHFGPLKWWTRSSRMVLDPARFRVSKTTRRLMKKSGYRVTFDTAFDEVIKACSGRRKGRPTVLTWVTPKIMRLYSALHEKGYAHSFEVWNDKGELAGGGYGLAIGRIFVTESMFSLEPNTSKMGFASLNWHLAKWGYVLNDGKDWNQYLEDAGLALIPRSDYDAILSEHAQGRGPAAPWTVEASLAEVAAWDPDRAAPATAKLAA